MRNHGDILALTADLNAALGAVNHFLVASCLVTGRGDLILADCFGGGMRNHGDILALAADFNATLGTVDHFIVASCFVAGRGNLILTDRFGGSMRVLGFSFSFRLSFRFGFRLRLGRHDRQSTCDVRKRDVLPFKVEHILIIVQNRNGVVAGGCIVRDYKCQGRHDPNGRIVSMQTVCPGHSKRVLGHRSECHFGEGTDRLSGQSHDRIVIPHLQLQRHDPGVVPDGHLDLNRFAGLCLRIRQDKGRLRVHRFPVGNGGQTNQLVQKQCQEKQRRTYTFDHTILLTSAGRRLRLGVPAPKGRSRIQVTCYFSSTAQSLRYCCSRMTSFILSLPSRLTSAARSSRVTAQSLRYC